MLIHKHKLLPLVGYSTLDPQLGGITGIVIEYPGALKVVAYRRLCPPLNAPTFVAVAPIRGTLLSVTVAPEGLQTIFWEPLP